MSQRRVRNEIRKLFVGGLVAIVSMFVLLSPASAATPSINVSGSRVSFNNTTKIGIDAAVGFTHRYNNAVSINGQSADAILTVKSFTLNTTKPTISNVDRLSSTFNYDLWTNLQIPSGGGEAVYNVSFVQPGTNDPVTLQGVTINVGDIDARQYVQFSGVQSYTLSNPTKLSVLDTSDPVTVGSIPPGSYRFWEPNATGADDNDRQFWAQVNYGLPISSVDVVLGATVGGPALFEVSFSAANWGTTPTTPTTVQADAVNYTVTYEPNGASGAVPAASTKPGGESHTISGNTGNLAKPNATFDSWNTRSDGTGVSYIAGETIIPTTNVSLYAIWRELITITYNGNDNTGGVAPSAVTATGLQKVASPGSLVKDGYTFIGWNTIADGTGVPYEPGEEFQPAANGILYAQWRENPIVPPNSPIDIPVNPGDPVGGAEIEYVVPDLDPNSGYVVELEGNGSTEELDAGVVDQSGQAQGTTSFPENVPEGNYVLIFESTASDGSDLLIEKSFVVGPDGKLVSKQDGVTTKITQLAKTGVDLEPLFLSGPAIMLGWIILHSARRRRGNA